MISARGALLSWTFFSKAHRVMGQRLCQSLTDSPEKTSENNTNQVQSKMKNSSKFSNRTQAELSTNETLDELDLWVKKR